MPPNSKNPYFSPVIYLAPFHTSHVATLCSWIKSEEELVLFAGPSVFRYPLTEEQFAGYLNKPGRRVYAALDNYTDALLGMGEIVAVSENTVRLCRILVGTGFRGRGIGQQLTLALLQQAFSDPQIQRVELNVYDFNQAAIRCYERCGFRIDNSVQGNPSTWKNWRGLRMVTLRNAQ